jgi:peptide/nickel transport system substrate-binding protein
VLVGNKDQPSNLEVAQELQRDLKAVGVDLQLAMVSRDALLKDYLAPRSYHLALVNWAAAGADPDLYAYWHSSQNTSGVDFSGWTNASADSALEGGLHVTDKVVRTRLYGEFQKAFAQDVPGIVLYYPLYAYATRQPAANVSLPQTDLLAPAQRFDTMADWTLRTDLPAR